VLRSDRNTLRSVALLALGLGTSGKLRALKAIQWIEGGDASCKLVHLAPELRRLDEQADLEGYQ